MKLSVLDTSALIRFYIPDGPIPTGLEEAMSSCLTGNTVLLVPELALVEAAQVLYKKEVAGYINQNEADEILEAILELPLEIIGHYDLLTDAYEISRFNGITLYDAMFMALAKKKNAELISADDELMKVFKHSSV